MDGGGSAVPYTAYPMLESKLSSMDDMESGVILPIPQSAAVASSHLVDPKSVSNPCVLSWQNLTYTVQTTKSSDNPEGKKTILYNVSGRCAPGELTAIMGPSGSGKTTLVDILADRISSGDISGNIELNGAPRVAKTFRAVASYVAQEDSLLGSFTVLETLRMAAKLSLPNAVTSSMIRERVDAVIDEMGLQSCRDTLVGDIFRKGISGGQKRRLSIAIELLSNPSVLILDEPTSGLDSSSTFNVMQFIVKLCQEGKTVICTIHQPSSLVYDMFTNVMLLAEGETVYFGPQVDTISHFASLGHDCPKYTNPSEYFLSLINTDFEGHVDVKHLISAYSQSEISNSLHKKLTDDRQILPHLADIETIPPSARRQFGVLLHRNLLNNIRNPGIYWIRLFMYVMLSFMIGTMYLYTNDDLSDEDYVPLLFYVQAFLVFMSVAVLPFFIEQRAVFQRERANNGLNVVSYVLANFFATLPGIFLIAVVSTLLVVLLADLNGFGWFLLNLFLSLVVAESLMHVIGAAVPHYIIGIALGAGIYGMFMLCEGFMVPRDSIPGYWIWAYYLAFHSYSFRAFAYTQFSGPEASETAHQILVRLNLEDVDVALNMGVLAIYVLCLQAIFSFILYKFHTGRR